MRILEMSLEDFQGVRRFAFSPNGKSCSVYGDNGTGKTTLYNAFTWLLYGKASTGEKGYTPKTTGSHNVNHIAEMLVQMDDGTVTRIRKDYHEVYKTVRGSAHAVMSGHTTDHYLDGVPVKESEYKAFVDRICGDSETAKMVTMPEYFLQEMHPSERRKVLLEVCGDISMHDVIAADKELADLPGILGKPGNPDSLYTVEEYRSIAKKAMQETDKELQMIPARIDEAEKSKPDITGIDADAVEKQLETLKQDVRTLEEQRASARSVSSAEVRKAIAECEEKIAVASSEFARSETEKNRKANESLIKAMSAEADAERACASKRNLIANYDLQIDAENRKLAAIAKEWETTNAKEWNEAETCPTCGQHLPQSKIDASKKKFNLDKSEKLEKLDMDGRKQVEAIDDLEGKKEALQKELDQVLDPSLKLARDAVAEAKSQIIPSENFYDTPEYKTLDAQKTRLKEALKDEEASAREATAVIDSEIAKVNTKIDELMRNKSNVAQVERINQRITELEEREKELAGKYEEHQRGIYLCELYTREKAKMLDEKINSRFETLSFRLFVEQQNGGIADDCEALIPCDGRKVPFKSANNAARINAGLELIDTLSDHYGVSLPVFVDNAESVVRLRHTDTQVIRLVVSDHHPELHFEAGL